MTAAAWFTKTHPLAGVARHRCITLHGTPPWWAVACGQCWEHAVRTDATVAALEDLPADLVTDPDLIDEVAVDRACAGHPVHLTDAETLVAVLRLRAEGLTLQMVADRLGRGWHTVYRTLREHRANTQAQANTRASTQAKTGSGVAA